MTVAYADNERTIRPAAARNDEHPAFRLLPIMRQGVGSSIPETWEHFATLMEARLAAKHMYQDDRVLRALIVTDTAPAHFVEWVER
jgi:hypothetical protein